MQYTLLIKSHDNRTVIEMKFELWATARQACDLLERGYSLYEYFVSIYDEYNKEIAYSALTKAL